MPKTQHKYLMYVEQNYSFEILQPIVDAIAREGSISAWYIHGNKANAKHLPENSVLLDSVDAVKTFNPRAVFVPGNVVPDFFPGIKVQVFHGLEWKKKDHFRLRGFFDLYCTHGPITSEMFKQLSLKHPYYNVIETGWSKLDPLFSTTEIDKEQQDKLQILYAPTFSKSLTSTGALYAKIAQLSKTGRFNWKIRFHPKEDPQTVEKYKKLSGPNLSFDNNRDITLSLQQSDILLSDTSSVVSEFLLLNKPAVTFDNKEPGDYIINITDADKLEQALDLASQPSQELHQLIKGYNQQVHPYTDGSASERILEAVEQCIQIPAEKSKPLNLLRKLKIRRSHAYYKFK
ncbi:CDP-glycerol glycerophosphotransferase family protein [Moritella yayanosii]|nr:CDP-glycerol glycerophosphotransferase family protein [Moritella yayanosii]